MKSKSLAVTVFLALLVLTGCFPSIFQPSATVHGSGNVVSESRSPSGFNQVTLDGQGDVTIVVGNNETLIVEAEDNLVKYIESNVRGSQLILSTTRGVNLRPEKPIKYLVTVKSLNGLTLNGSGNINTKQAQADIFTMMIQGSGSIQVENLSAKRVNVQIPGSGTIKLGGQVDTQSVAISGSGKYQADNLKTQSADITINGSGSVIVWSTGTLKASIPGSGTVTYYGTPLVTKSVTGSGSVTQSANASPTVPLPTQTPTILPFAIQGGHTTTTWDIETNLAYDALCFIPTLTGDPFFLKHYQQDYDRFSGKLNPTVQQALDDLRTVAKQQNVLLSPALIQIFLPLAPKTLDDILFALDNPETIRLGVGASPDEENWKLFSSLLPKLKTIIQWMNEVGFEQDYQERITPKIQNEVEFLNRVLPGYNIIPILEATLGEALPSDRFTIYLANYPLPFGTGLGANVSLFYWGLPSSTIVDNALHENLHLIDIQEKDLWEALSFLQQDSYYMNNFKTHDTNSGYMVYEEYLEEDVIEALDQYLAEKFDADENPLVRWGNAATGTHKLSPVLYTLIKQENYVAEKETYHDFLIRVIQEGKLKPGTIEEANHQFYASNP